MKIYIPIIIMLFLGCKSIKTSTNNNVSNNGTTSIPKYQKLNTFKGTVNDTLIYVRTSIIARKSKYVGKELNVLLNDLELPINSYLIGSSNLIGISPDISFKFYPKNVVELKRQNRIDPVILTVLWEMPLPKDVVIPLLLKSKGTWNKLEQEYYGKQKIKDIVLTDYKFQ